MARYEHLPIYRAAYDIAVYIEKIVRQFARYHKYTLGSELRRRSLTVLEGIVRANNAANRAELLLGLRQEVEAFKVVARLSHDSGAFSTKKYLYLSEKLTEIAKQNEGWLKKAQPSRA